jgi:hypothetical protein
MHNRRGERAKFLVLGAVSLSVGAVSVSALAGTVGAEYVTTKTPYQPRQAIASYEAVPKGFVPMHTQIVARHGSRGLTSMKDELALLNLWKLARSENALTPLGERLGPDLERLIEINALLGYGVPGISKPGYGNLSRIGIEEHQQLAKRMVQRLPALFQRLGTDPDSSGASIRVQHSGVDRARDSAGAFVDAMVASVPAIAPRLVYPVVDGYPDSAPVAQAPGVNRFLLYFHRLNARNDAVTRETDPLSPIYTQSQIYQTYAKGQRVEEKVTAARSTIGLSQAAITTLQRLFSKSFVEQLASGSIQVANTGEFNFTSGDGKFTNRLVGDGKVTIKSPLQALLALSSVYEIAPGLKRELGFGLQQYLPPVAARLLSEANDAEDFYTKGPGIAEDQPVTYAMAAALLQDFFVQIDNTTAGPQGRGASLRFTHAEILVPFASILRIKNMSTPLPWAANFSYGTSAWRGQDVAPYAANVQWDTFSDAKGTRIVRMLYNEKETDFQSMCDSARLRPKSYFYRFEKLKACYGF